MCLSTMLSDLKQQKVPFERQLSCQSNIHTYFKVEKITHTSARKKKTFHPFDWFRKTKSLVWNSSLRSKSSVTFIEMREKRLVKEFLLLMRNWDVISEMNDNLIENVLLITEIIQRIIDVWTDEVNKEKVKFILFDLSIEIKIGTRRELEIFDHIHVLVQKGVVRSFSHDFIFLETLKLTFSSIKQRGPITKFNEKNKMIELVFSTVTKRSRNICELDRLIWILKQNIVCHYLDQRKDERQRSKNEWKSVK